MDQSVVTYSWGKLIANEQTIFDLDGSNHFTFEHILWHGHLDSWSALH